MIVVRMPAVRKVLIISIFSIFLALAFAACGGDDDSSSTSDNSGSEETSTTAESPSGVTASDIGVKKPKIVVPSGPPPKTLEKNDLLVGQGPAAKAGDEVAVQYVGVGYESKKEFDTSWGGEPFAFELGSGLVIKGWEQGIVGMNVGGRRELVIPGELAYGPEGSPPKIGPNETLIFVIDLLGAR
jgi:peptidylprolyl isomerase